MIFIYSFISASPVQAQNYFSFANNKLSISTPLMEMAIESGVVVYVKDKASGEVLVNTGAGGVGATFSAASPNQGKISYANGQVIEVTVDSTSGEITLQSLAGKTDIPINNMTNDSVILGSGARYTRSDPAKTDYSNYRDLLMPGISIFVSEGKRSVVAAWSELKAPDPGGVKVELQHTPALDNVVLKSKQLPSPPWRFGTYPNWWKAARRWGQRFEQRTGARPLWNNLTPWVRNVHAVYQEVGLDAAKFAQLKSVCSPEKPLMFIWNGDRIVLFGDHTYVAGSGERPSRAQIDAMKANGHPLMAYHPINLIRSERGRESWLAFLRGLGWVPAGYSFNPDYEGTPGNWYSYWADVSSNYFDASEFYYLHPGSTKFRNYFIRNFANYCTVHRCDGAYLDTLGVGMNDAARPDQQIRDGFDFVTGMANTVEQARQALPNLGMMSEVGQEYVLPFTFYSWSGSDVFKRQNEYAGTKINHPLFGALRGRYVWLREDHRNTHPDNRPPEDYALNALMGTLPHVGLVGDYDTNSDIALWSQQRAKLFCDQELFNDIPDNWDPAALAYYRSKSGHWFKYKKVGSSYAYVEELPGGQEVVRLAQGGTYVSPPPGPTSPTPTPPFLPGDLDRDGDVDIYDYNLLVTDFGKTGSPGWIAADIDRNGKVDIYDYNILVGNFGRTI